MGDALSEGGDALSEGRDALSEGRDAVSDEQARKGRWKAMIHPGARHDIMERWYISQEHGMMS